MTNKLCDKLLNGKDQHRDIASIALKTIVSEVTTSAVAQCVLVSLSPQLIKGITSPVSSENYFSILALKLIRIWEWKRVLTFIICFLFFIKMQNYWSNGNMENKLFNWKLSTNFYALVAVRWVKCYKITHELAKEALRSSF